jgi:hypothetical protein
MAKRGQDSGGSVNLFPFLSILICIIGCLTLIIVVINLIAMSKGEGKTPEEVERAREYILVKKDKEDKQTDLDKLRIDIENLIQENKNIIQDRDKLVMLKDMLENQEEIDKSREELIAKFNLLSSTNKQLVADETRLQEEIKKKEEEIEKRKLPPEPAALRVRPSGSSSSTKPFFAEVSDTSVYLHQSLTVDPVVIPVASLNQDEGFIKLLKEIASANNNRLIFLVRGTDGAVSTLNRARSVVRAFNQSTGSNIIPGRLPLPGEGKVDLNMFAQFLEP